jgi:hypothetical protein
MDIGAREVERWRREHVANQEGKSMPQANRQGYEPASTVSAHVQTGADGPALLLAEKPTD